MTCTSEGEVTEETSNEAVTYESNVSPDKSKSSSGALAFWMLLLAAAAVAFAVGAAIMGSRKKSREMHPLQGSVARRMTLFGQFANSAALCTPNTDGLCGSSRPDRVVEMTMPNEDSAMV
jgi:hypothetical protein